MASIPQQKTYAPHNNQ